MGKVKAATLAELEAAIVAQMCKDPVLKTRIGRATRLRKNHERITQWFLSDPEARRRLHSIALKEAEKLGVKVSSAHS